MGTYTIRKNYVEGKITKAGSETISVTTTKEYSDEVDVDLSAYTGITVGVKSDANTLTTEIWVALDGAKSDWFYADSIMPGDLVSDDETPPSYSYPKTIIGPITAFKLRFYTTSGTATVKAKYLMQS